MKTVMCLLLWIAFACVMSAGLLTPAQAQGIWRYSCYQSPDAAVNFMNTLSTVRASNLKFFPVYTIGAGYTQQVVYCVVYQS